MHDERFFATIPVWVIVLFVAPFVGSLMGVLIRRLPTGRPVALARSECETCGTNLSSVDMVPLISFAALRGRCRHCQAPIGGFHLAVEATALLIAVWAVLVDKDSGRVVADCMLGWSLVTLAWIDYGHYRLPDALTLPLIVLGLFVTWLLDPENLAANAVACCFGFLLLSAIGSMFRLIRKRDGIGGGDMKLMAAVGAWVGPAGVGPVLAGGAILTLGFVALSVLRGKPVGRDTQVPFGPGLALAFWVVYLYLHSTPDGSIILPWG